MATTLSRESAKLILLTTGTMRLDESSLRETPRMRDERASL